MAVGRPDADALAAILHDPCARLDERDDAAMDLATSDDPRTITLLLGLARDPLEHELIVASAGESLAAIAVRSGRLDPTWLEGLRAEASVELVGAIKSDRPDLIQ